MRSLFVTSISKEYRELYAGYYADPHGGLATKRALAAADSLQHIRQLLDGYNPETIIDVGAGNGSVLEALQHSDLGNRLIAVEISASGIADIKARQLPKLIDVQLFNGYEIPYGDGAFDLAIAIHVLEHVEHERVLLRELRRVAKRIIVEVPLENGLRAQSCDPCRQAERPYQLLHPGDVHQPAGDVRIDGDRLRGAHEFTGLRAISLRKV